MAADADIGALLSATSGRRRRRQASGPGSRCGMSPGRGHASALRAGAGRRSPCGRSSWVSATLRGGCCFPRSHPCARAPCSQVDRRSGSAQHASRARTPAAIPNGARTAAAARARRSLRGPKSLGLRATGCDLHVLRVARRAHEEVVLDRLVFVFHFAFDGASTEAVFSGRNGLRQGIATPSSWSSLRLVMQVVILPRMCSCSTLST